jgi:hypothetical protein
MSDVFGDQTVTFVAITDGAKDRLGIPAEVATPVAVTGCRFRPFSVEETVNITDVATEMWKCTAPPVAAVLSAKSIDRLIHKNITYDLVGSIKPFNDASDQVYKVTVMCKKQTV